MKILAIVQARMGSTRLPGKVMRPVNGIPLIEYLLKRLSLSNQIDRIVLAVPDTPENKTLAAHVKGLGYDVVAGSENDVLDRYYQAAQLFKPDGIVRITGDCPLVDPQVVDRLLRSFKEGKSDYVSNVCPPTYPDGLDVEVFSYSALCEAWRDASLPFEREHVTPYIRESDRFTSRNVAHTEDISGLRLTVDEESDLDVVGTVFENFSPHFDFSWLEVLQLYKDQPEVFAANQHLIRNEGRILGTGQKLWKHAKQIIPGGNMLLSKRAEMFLPDQWPAYFRKAKGCKVWDLDGNEYIDLSIMGVGTNILGYGHPEVDAAVQKSIVDGNMSTLNCPEEVSLAERLVELHPWADMVRFCRSGGEANAVAIRIARAASGKEKVAFCGYHGWHDWYLAANLSNDESLSGHLLPGLAPTGVPPNLRETIFPFTYNNFNELQALVDNYEIGVIKMEVVRNESPEDGFLEKVRALATERGIVLIFDECTSGFRQTCGGLHLQYGVEPDMAVFGKALGNGYAITAAIGRKEVMDAAQKTFISSTFWTERIGPTAALKSLEVMERVKSWVQITQVGRSIVAGWKALAKKYALDISIGGLPSLAGFSFNSPSALAYKTLITQEMLKKGYLAGTSVYACTEHDPETVDTFFEVLDPVFGLIKECEEDRDVQHLLKGPVCHAGFKRLN